MPDLPIVILGGGFAGCAAARALTRVLRQRDVVLASRDNFITYNPLLPEVVGASIAPVHAVAPLRQVAPRARAMMVNVTHIDFAARRLHYLGEGSGEIAWDQLVLAFGTDAKLDLVPGMERYGLPLKTLGDALFLRNRVMSRLEQADLVDDPEQRRWLLQFVVVGGGFSGVEVAGEIADFLRAARQFYPRVRMDEACVTVLHKGDHLLPELPARLGDAGCRMMREDGISIELHARVLAANDRGVSWRDGSGQERFTAAGTIVNTLGTEPNALLGTIADGHPGLTIARGRIVTNADMSVPGLPGVWAIGDCAAVPNAQDGAASPPTAQFAERQGRQLAANIGASIAGQPTRPFRYRALGQLSSIGRHSAVAEVLSLQASGLVGFLLWRALYLMKFPTFARKARIFLEWTWDLVFRQDIANLKFVRSRPPAKAAEAPVAAQAPMWPYETVDIPPAALAGAATIGAGMRMDFDMDMEGMA